MKKQELLVVTVDGPSGAGKGTLCQLLAQKLGFHLLDSGALYRLTALAGLDAGLDLHDEPQVAAVAAKLDVVFEVNQAATVIRLNGREVTQDIRQEQIGMGASIVAAHTQVRDALLQRQRAFAQAPGLVADGRDMGTVVFPEAQIKVFLTASAAERARRRVEQLQKLGVAADYDAILSDIEARDHRDSNRQIAPLKPATDAVEIDSTNLSIESVVQKVLDLVPRAEINL